MGDLAVRVQPRAKRDQVVGLREGRLVIRLSAPPVDGKANAALTAFVAKQASVPRSRVSVVKGQTSRDKVVRVEGLTDGELRAAFGLADAGEVR